MANNDHAIYYNSKGDEIPSVTTVLKLLNNNLDGWHNYMGFRRINTKDYVETAATKGTIVHSLFERYCKGKIDDMYCPDEYESELFTPEQITIYLCKFRLFLEYFNNRGYIIYKNELQMEGERCGGTADILLYNKTSGKYILLDLKSSKNIYPKMYMQLAGYTMLLRETMNIEVSMVGIILFNRDFEDNGFFNLRTVDDNSHNEEIFNSFLNIYYSMSKNDLHQILK